MRLRRVVWEDMVNGIQVRLGSYIWLHCDEM